MAFGKAVPGPAAGGGVGLSDVQLVQVWHCHDCLKIKINVIMFGTFSHVNPKYSDCATPRHLCC